MINKKNVLGKEPMELGDKDAIHVAIVAVRAARLISPGERCGLNEHREAVPDSKGVGVADPFLKANIVRGQVFWLLLAQDAVPNVQHVWEHPTVDFAPPTREVERNKYLQQYADELGVTYEQLMAACAFVVENDDAAPYPGTKDQKEWEDTDTHDIWYEWSGETGHEFENYGTECCPEYNYPKELFYAPDKDGQ
jgi:hypothetical protein